MIVGDLCTRDVIVAEKQASIVELAKLMREYHVGNVVIIDKVGSARKPVGIVTDRDIILELIAKEQPLDSVGAGDIMSANLVLVEENLGIWEALQIMQREGVRRLPVVDQDGFLIGILSTDDIFEALADQLQDLALLISKGQRREKKFRQ